MKIEFRTIQFIYKPSYVLYVIIAKSVRGARLRIAVSKLADMFVCKIGNIVSSSLFMPGRTYLLESRRQKPFISKKIPQDDTIRYHIRSLWTWHTGTTYIDDQNPKTETRAWNIFLERLTVVQHKWQQFNMHSNTGK